MQDIVNPVQNLSYTNKDFETVYPELLDLVKELTYKWDPSVSNESDPGVLLLKLNAIIADKCDYNIDKNVLECFPLSVTQETNARQLFEQLGYIMHWYKGATVTISMKYSDSATNEKAVGPITYIIPAFTMVSDDEDSIVYTLVGPTAGTTANSFIVNDGELKNDESTITFKAIQGIAVEYSTNDDSIITPSHLDENNRLYFPTTNIAENGIFITNYSSTGATNNYSDWEKKDNLLVEEQGNTYYKFGVTQDGSQCYIEFPSDAESIIKDGIKITYIRTDGTYGNISSQVVNKFYNDLSAEVKDSSTGEVVTLNSDNVKISNFSSATNGVDPEGINDAYIGYKKTVGTFDTLVTLRDYLNYIVSSDYLASNGFVCDRKTDIQNTMKVMSSVDDIDQQLTKVEQINKFDSYSNELTYSVGDVVEHSGFAYVCISAISTPEDWTPSHWSLLNNVSATETALTSFSLKLYMLQYGATNITNAVDFNKTFSMLTNDEQVDIKDYIDDAKSIQHDYVDIKSPDATYSHFCYFKNKYPIVCTIVTQYQLTTTQAQEVITNIKNALYSALNSRQLNFGDEISVDLIYDTIGNADTRIKSVILENIEYTTYAVYYEEYLDSYGVTQHRFTEVEITSEDDEPITTTTTGSLVVSVNEDLFVDKLGIGNYATITCTCLNASSWSVNNTVTTKTLTTAQLGSQYGITYTGTAQVGNVITARVSLKTQFRDEIMAKSVLAGCTQLLTSDEEFDYRMNQTLCDYKAPFSTSSTYAVGDEVVYSGKMYRCHTAITVAGAWDATKWTLLGAFAGYAVGDYVIHNDVLYWCTTAITTAEAWNSSKWARPTDSSGDYIENVIPNIEKVSTNVQIVFGENSDDMEAYDSIYTLRTNEHIQFYAPNLIDGSTYSDYVKYEYKLYSAVATDETYQLVNGEYIALYWKDENNENAVYNYCVYGPGNIFSPNFDLEANTTGGVVANRLIELYRNVGTEENPVYKSDSNYNGSMLLAYSKEIAAYSDTDHILSGTKTITMKSLNQITLDSTYYCYWILNDTIDDNGVTKYRLFEADDSATPAESSYKRLLGAGEYFFYTNATLTDLAILGSGTEIVRNSTDTNWEVEVIDSTEVFDTGVTALSSADAWFAMASAETATITENQHLTIGPGCSVKIVPRISAEHFTLTAGDCTTIQPSQITINPTAWLNSEYGGTIGNFSFTYNGTNWRSNNKNVDLGDFGLSISVTAVSGMAFKIFVKNIWTITFALTGTTIAVPTEGVRVKDPTLSDFSISYTTTAGGQWIPVEDMTLEAHAGWQARSLLALSATSTNEQVLLDNQSINYWIHGDSTMHTLTGKAEEGNTYPVVFMSSLPLEAEGSETTATTDVDDAGDTVYTSFYVYKTMTSDYGDATYSTTGSVTLKFAVSETAKSFEFSVPKGDYVLTIQNPRGGLDTLNFFLDGTASSNKLHAIYDSSLTNFTGTDAYYLAMTISDVKKHTLYVQTGTHTQEITILVDNAYKYVKPESMTSDYFDKILYLVNKFDSYHNYKYTFQVDEDTAIEDPLLPRAFLQSTHIYNPFTICQFDTSANSKVYVTGKR